MEIFNIRDLRNRTGDLVRAAEHGRLSLVTKHGQPVFLAVPVDDALLKCGVGAALAVALVAEQVLGLVQVARIAGVAPADMMDILAEHRVSLVGYSADELTDEVGQFKDE